MNFYNVVFSITVVAEDKEAAMTEAMRVLPQKLHAGILPFDILEVVKTGEVADDPTSSY